MSRCANACSRVANFAAGVVAAEGGHRSRATVKLFSRRTKYSDCYVHLLLSPSTRQYRPCHGSELPSFGACVPPVNAYFHTNERAWIPLSSEAHTQFSPAARFLPCHKSSTHDNNVMQIFFNYFSINSKTYIFCEIFIGSLRNNVFSTEAERTRTLQARKAREIIIYASV